MSKKKDSAFMKILDEAKDVYTFLDRIKDTYPQFIQMSKEYNTLKEDNASMRAQLDHVSQELEKVSKEFASLSKEASKKIDMREILTLSMTLLTEVFGAQPHSKLLFLLHGEKEEWTRNDLVKASGISAAAIRKALADLDASKLVKYDVETGTVELLRRLY